MKPLTRQQFRDALRKGLGRTVLHAREHGLGDFEEDLLHACLHNQAYDAQAEDSRADYLLFFLNYVHDKDALRRCILQALLDSSDRRDTQQLLDLACRFAKDGHPDAREALYRRFDRGQNKNGWPGVWQIIALDDIDGLLHVAKVVGTALRDGSGTWEDERLVSVAAERLGRDFVLKALESSASQDPDVGAFLALNMSKGAFQPDRRTPGQRSRTPPPTLEKILAAVEATDGEPRRSRLESLGWRASPEDADTLFDGLLQETRREQLRRYLQLFGRRPMPRLHPRIMELATSDADEQVQIDAIRALSRVTAPAVREVGLRLLREQPSAVFRDVIRLFRQNYQAGDEAIIRTALPAEADDKAMHWVGLDLVALTSEVDQPELFECVVWLYEQTPCSYCRNSAYETLMKWRLAPTDILAEARWDSCHETREQALKAIGED